MAWCHRGALTTLHYFPTQIRTSIQKEETPAIWLAPCLGETAGHIANHHNILEHMLMLL